MEAAENGQLFALVSLLLDSELKNVEPICPSETCIPTIFKLSFLQSERIT